MMDEFQRTREFSKRLHEAMVAKKMTQSELAEKAFGRRVNYQGKDIPAKRDQVSGYLTAKRMPNAENLRAIAEALNMKPDELMPPPDRPQKGKPMVNMVIYDDGTARVQIDALMEPDRAQRIIAALYGEWQ